jgi:outer membrane receptor protein involved in Fe transport
VTGAEYVHHDLRVRVFGEPNERTQRACVEDAITNGFSEEAACPPRQLESDIRGDQHAVAAFAQDTLDLVRNGLVAGDALVATVAARWDWLRHAIDDRSPPSDRGRSDGTHAFNRLNPSIGFNYNLSRDHTAYFAFSEGFRAPAFLELTCAGPGAVCPGLQAGVAPDPPLKAVKARNYELGLRSRPTPWLDAEVTLFRTDVRDDIFSVSPTGTVGVFFQNIGATRRQGVEVGLRGRVARVLDWYANYALTDATFRDDIVLSTPRLTPDCPVAPCAQTVRTGNALPLIPRHRANVGLDYHVTDWLTISLAATYVGVQRLRGDEANSERPLDEYVVVNAGLKARWKKATAFLSINNVLNTEYETFGTFAPNAKRVDSPIERFLTPAPPIHVVGGLRYTF